jgi:hypothetical protein
MFEEARISTFAATPIHVTSAGRASAHSTTDQKARSLVISVYTRCPSSNCTALNATTARSQSNPYNYTDLLRFKLSSQSLKMKTVNFDDQ